MVTRNLLCVPSTVASSSFISNARRRATAFTCAHPKGVRFHGSGVKYRAWQPHAAENGSKITCCVHVRRGAGSDLATGPATGRRTALAAAGAISPLPVQEPLGQLLTDALAVSEHHSAEGKSGGVSTSPSGLHPWKGLGDVVTTIRHAMGQSRAPAPLDGLRKQILRFPC